jgi:hypothetical protein
MEMVKVNQIVVIYFFVQERVLPTIEEYHAKSGNESNYVKKIKEEISMSEDELKKYLDYRDWGLASFYASTMVDKIFSLLSSTKLKPFLDERINRIE